MKKFIYMFATLFIMTSCEIEMSDNGDLDGFWQMMEMHDIDGNTIDMRETGTIWAFQFNLLELRSRADQNGIICRFEHKADHLRVYDPRVQRHIDSDKPVTDPIILNPFGIYTLDEDFKIETLNGDYMTLVSEKVRLKFRKY